MASHKLSHTADFEIVSQKPYVPVLLTTRITEDFESLETVDADLGPTCVINAFLRLKQSFWSVPLL
jgi:hypothetical protein